MYSWGMDILYPHVTLQYASTHLGLVMEGCEWMTVKYEMKMVGRMCQESRTIELTITKNSLPSQDQDVC